MGWPLDKIFGWMAFFIAEDPEFKARMQEENMSKEQRTKILLAQLGGEAK